MKENYKDTADTAEHGNGMTSTRQNKGATAKALVLNDGDVASGGFWSGVEEHVKLTLPIYKLLRRHDSSAPTVGKVYHGFFEVGESIKASNATYREQASDKFDARWAYGHVDFFAAAYVVDPEFINHDQSSNEEVMHGFYETVEKL